MKSHIFRPHLWKAHSIRSFVLDIDYKNEASAIVYKYIFVMWQLSFDSSLIAQLKEINIVAKLQEILSTNRVEKVVRISLTLLKTLLEKRLLCEEIVEAGMHEAVKNLEYEKWRDAELYDEIRALGGHIGTEMKELSNFDRYERELDSGKLSWGFVHDTKFWGENVMKFDQNDFRAVKTLAKLLHSTDPTTLAVACHDIGEFVTLHPLGKKTISTLLVKERVMELMGASGDDYRDVRREALLCCQKIMLNKWQELGNDK